jgi:hypothetical protein
LKSANHTAIERESLKFFIPSRQVPPLLAPRETAKAITLIKLRRGTVCWCGFSNCLTYAISIEFNRATLSGWLTHYLKTEMEDEAVEKAWQLAVREGEVIENLEDWRKMKLKCG